MTKLVVTYTERPWWFLGLIKQERVMSFEPPADYSLRQINESATKLRDAGYGVRIIW